MTSHRLDNRAIIRLSATEAGEDIRGFLQGLVTQDTQAQLPLWAGFLTPQGKALFDFILWADGDDVLIDCEAAQAEALTKRLSIYRLRRKISIDVDPQLAVYWSKHAPDEGAKRHNIDMGPWPIGIHIDPRHADLGYRWLSARTDAIEDGSTAYHAHRLSLGVAEGIAELGSEATLWLECNAAELNGVSFSKGCYVGQENTARMNWRQKVNRRLIVVPLEKADPDRTRITYPELGFAVVHMRVEDITADIWPDWLPQVQN
jgi:folate-binding protein YgfZ